MNVWILNFDLHIYICFAIFYFFLFFWLGSYDFQTNQLDTSSHVPILHKGSVIAHFARKISKIYTSVFIGIGDITENVNKTKIIMSFLVINEF